MKVSAINLLALYPLPVLNEEYNVNSSDNSYLLVTKVVVFNDQATLRYGPSCCYIGFDLFQFVFSVEIDYIL